MTSIIVTCWNKIHFMAFCSMSTIASIRAFTKPSDYELITIETAGVKIWDGYGNLDLKNGIYIERDIETEDQGYCADMNQGASLSSGEYLVFIENDVILHEGWLEGLRYYLDNNLADVIIPNQIWRGYDEMQKLKELSYEEAMNKGIQEQGLMMIRRETFEKAGGWDDRFRKTYGWKAFQQRLGKVDARIFTTDKVFISHIGGATYWWDSMFNKEEYEKVVAQEHEIMKAEGL